jgi:hypothetical protein
MLAYYFYKLASVFHSGKLRLQNLNRSYITLIPKVVAPVEVNDFRPISLTNVHLKYLTKLAPNRLHIVLIPLLVRKMLPPGLSLWRLRSPPRRRQKNPPPKCPLTLPPPEEAVRGRRRWVAPSFLASFAPSLFCHSCKV